jgi:hypothetical protein
VNSVKSFLLVFSFLRENLAYGLKRNESDTIFLANLFKLKSQAVRNDITFIQNVNDRFT